MTYVSNMVLNNFEPTEIIYFFDSPSQILNNFFILCYSAFHIL